MHAEPTHCSRTLPLIETERTIFTAALYQPRQPRVENGTLGTVTEASGDDRVSIETKGARGREVQLSTEELGGLRLAYAQHLYKAQGRTVDRSFVLIGGWQTDRERAYVGLTRARERTDIYVSRDDLGEEGMNAGAIERLGESMGESRAEEASIRVPTPEPLREVDAVAIGDRELGSDRADGFDFPGC
jgi:ATP-dependent exoDNAse (exonuclease V) alpha subunit